MRNPSDNDPSAAFSREEAAEFLGISNSAFSRMRREGKLPAPVQLGTRILRWRRRDLELWLEQLPAETEGGVQ